MSSGRGRFTLHSEKDFSFAFQPRSPASPTAAGEMLVSAFPHRLPPPVRTGDSSDARREAPTPLSANQQTAAPTVLSWMIPRFGIPLLENWS